MTSTTVPDTSSSLRRLRQRTNRLVNWVTTVLLAVFAYTALFFMGDVGNGIIIGMAAVVITNEFQGWYLNRNRQPE
jgi:hypothetical protein